jgi:hypothetical protein
MHEYELCIEAMNPCGGKEYARREIMDVETDSPEKWVKANAPLPILDITEANGSIIITTGDGHGYITRYMFTL